MNSRQVRGSGNGSLLDEFHAQVAVQIGGRVRRRRRAMDLTQEELAFRAVVHRTQITLFERGIRLPHIDTLIRVASGLEVSPCQLIAGIDWVSGGGEDASAEERALITRRTGGQIIERPGGTR